MNSEPPTKFPGQYFERLQILDANGWKSDFRRPVATKVMLADLASLHNSDSLALQETGRVLKKCLSRMRKCKHGNHCKLLCCPRCGRAENYELARHNAAIISRHTTSRRGLALAFGVYGIFCVGTVQEAGRAAINEITEICQVLDKRPELDGYRISLDAAPARNPGGTVSSENSTIWELESAFFHFHFHGTLLLKKDYGYERFYRDLQSLDFEGPPRQFFCRPLKSSYRTCTGVKKNQIVCYKDAAAWCCYSDKLQSRGKNPPCLARVLQRGLYGCQRVWTGGRLRADDSAKCRKIKAKQICDWVYEARNELRHAIETSGAEVEMRRKFDSLVETTQRLETNLTRQIDRERKRKSRRKKAMAKLISRYSGTRLETERQAYLDMSAERCGRRYDEMQRAAESTQRLWEKLERKIARAVEKLAYSLSEHSPLMAKMCLQWLKDDLASSNPFVNSVVLMAAVIRRTNRHRELAKARVPKTKRPGALSFNENPTEEEEELGDLGSLFQELREFWEGVDSGVFGSKEEIKLQQFIRSFASQAILD